jgi:hypothetical protein
MPAEMCWEIPKERNYIEDAGIENNELCDPVEVLLGGTLKLRQTSNST